MRYGILFVLILIPYFQELPSREFATAGMNTWRFRDGRDIFRELTLRELGTLELTRYSQTNRGFPEDVTFNWKSPVCVCLGITCLIESFKFPQGLLLQCLVVKRILKHVLKQTLNLKLKSVWLRC